MEKWIRMRDEVSVAYVFSPLVFSTNRFYLIENKLITFVQMRLIKSNKQMKDNVYRYDGNLSRLNPIDIRLINAD